MMRLCGFHGGSRQASERSTIVAYAFAIPIPAGQTEAVRRFTEHVSVRAGRRSMT